MKKIRQQLVTVLAVLLAVATTALLGCEPARNGRHRPGAATTGRRGARPTRGVRGHRVPDVRRRAHATWTPRVLAILRKYGVKAVFFEVGQNVSWYP